jgi:gas vesicle protein
MKGIEAQHRRGILIGAIIGALLGATTAYFLLTTPADPEQGEAAKPLRAKDLLDLTSTATKLLRQLDSVRNKT